MDTVLCCVGVVSWWYCVAGGIVRVVLRLTVSIVRAACGVVVLGGSAACGAAAAAASVLPIVFFAQGARERAESLMSIGLMVLRLMVSVVRAVSGDVAISVGCPAVCGAAGTAVLADLFAFVEFFDNSSAERLIWKLWLVGSFASLDGW